MQIIDQDHKEVILRRIIFGFKPLDKCLEPVVHVERIKRGVGRDAEIVRVQQTVELLANDSQQFEIVRRPRRCPGESQDPDALFAQPLLAVLIHGGEDSSLAGAVSSLDQDGTVAGRAVHHQTLHFLQDLVAAIFQLVACVVDDLLAVCQVDECFLDDFLRNKETERKYRKYLLQVQQIRIITKLK